MTKETDKQWYALRVTYCQEMKVKYDLDSNKIESFIPMKISYRIRGERRVKVLSPAINNLVFVHLSEKRMKEYKEQTAMPVRYIMDRESKKPIVIPELQMKNFIGIAGTLDDQLVYLNSNAQNYKPGQKVRIVGGVFEGYEGTLLRIKGDRRVMVEIPGLIAVATGFIHPSLLEPVEE